MGDQPQNDIECCKKLMNDLLYDKAAFPYTVMACELFEEKTGQKRETLAYIVVGVYSFYLVIGYFGEIVCNFTAFAYPAYASFKAIKTTGKDDDTAWLTYWTCFACFSCMDFFSEPFMEILPLYWLLKAAFLFYLYAPGVFGAKKMYTNVVEPLMNKIETSMSKSAKSE